MEPLRQLFYKHLLTHWDRDKMAVVSQTIFSNAFPWMKMYGFRLKFHWSLFLRFQLTIFQHWFRYWLGAVQATSHYLNQCWLDHWRIYASLGLNELIDCFVKLNQYQHFASAERQTPELSLINDSLVLNIRPSSLSPIWHVVWLWVYAVINIFITYIVCHIKIYIGACNMS